MVYLSLPMDEEKLWLGALLCLAVHVSRAMLRGEAAADGATKGQQSPQAVVLIPAHWEIHGTV